MTKTEQNLRDAFAGESQARNKYTYFATTAKKEGYEKVAAIFLETADNKKEHAKLHLKHLRGIGSTIDNLRAAAAGELYECTEMYPRMSREARDEGFPEIAFLFESIGKIEKSHQERYRKLLEELETNTFFASPLEMSQLRPHPRRLRCPRGLPCPQASPGIFRAHRRTLLIPSIVFGGPVSRYLENYVPRNLAKGETPWIRWTSIGRNWKRN